MHRLITCDDVFEVLTRGRFPTGDASDAEVELHLAGCHECRQLAEALRPAVGLLHEALSDEGLPAYEGSRGELAPWHHIAPAVEPAPSIKRRSPGSVRRATDFAVAQAVRLTCACLLIGVMIGFATLFGSFGSSWRNGGEGVRAQLMSAPLPELCRASLVSALMPGAQRSDCCSHCHTAALHARQQAPMTQLVSNSCRGCHE
ncbi:MAG: hypothetical protein KDB14_18665 [Planctomycetales bacterium]|nr:hypothetical protein [Planctomycetales bacterium]